MIQLFKALKFCFQYRIVTPIDWDAEVRDKDVRFRIVFLNFKEHIYTKHFVLLYLKILILIKSKLILLTDVAFSKY